MRILSSDGYMFATDGRVINVYQLEKNLKERLVKYEYDVEEVKISISYMDRRIFYVVNIVGKDNMFFELPLEVTDTSREIKEKQKEIIQFYKR